MRSIRNKMPNTKLKAEKPVQIIDENVVDNPLELLKFVSMVQGRIKEDTGADFTLAKSTGGLTEK